MTPRSTPTFRRVLGRRVLSSRVLGRRAILIAGAAALPALASDPPTGAPFIARTLLDHTLTTHPALIHRIDASTITFTDAHGLLQRRPTADYLAILPGDGPTGWRLRDDAHTLALIDGQRFPGYPLATDPDLDDPPVAWDAGFARLDIPLDSVAALSAPGTPTPPAAATGDDLLHLTNGDTLSGFILSLGLDCSIETDAGISDIPLDLVSWARIANPPEPPAGPMIWLSDGTVACIELLPQPAPESIAARLIKPEPGAASLSEDTARDDLTFPLASIRALAFEPARLLPLGSLAVAAASSDRPWTPALIISDAADEPLAAPDITLPAPMSVTWLIPAGAERLALVAALPARARVWGDAELIITLEQDGADTELARTRLTGVAPTATFNLELPAPSDPRRDRRLDIRLEAGDSGPAQDAVTLHRPLLLLAPL